MLLAPGVGRVMLHRLAGPQVSSGPPVPVASPLVKSTFTLGVPVVSGTSTAKVSTMTPSRSRTVIWMHDADKAGDGSSLLGPESAAPTLHKLAPPSQVSPWISPSAVTPLLAPLV